MFFCKILNNINEFKIIFHFINLKCELIIWGLVDAVFFNYYNEVRNKPNHILRRNRDEIFYRHSEC